jgi:glutathione S-transferase
MDLYFAPLACTLATRIALYDSGQEARFIEVDLRTKKVLADGSDYFAVNPLGQVPALRIGSGEVLYENGAVLQYVADQAATAGLAPPAGSYERYRLQRWLSFIGSELQKGVFIPLLDPDAPEGAKAFARAKATLRFDYLNRILAERDYLLGRFTVADAYLVTILNWTVATEINLADWPALKAYHARLHQRPSIARAFAEERALYDAEQARHKAA